MLIHRNYHSFRDQFLEIKAANVLKLFGGLLPGGVQLLKTSFCCCEVVFSGYILYYYMYAYNYS